MGGDGRVDVPLRRMDPAIARVAPPDTNRFARFFSLLGSYSDSELGDAWAAWVRFVTFAAPLHLLVVKYSPGGDPSSIEEAASFLASALCATLVAVGRSQRLAVGLVAATLALEAALQFPETPNHLYLHAFVATLTYCGDAGEGRERANAITALRWVLLVVMGWAGAQKLVHGAYWHGEYLTYVTALKPFVRGMLGWTMAAEDLQRLVAFGVPSTGDGPYRVDAPVLWIAGVVTWVAELGIAVGLLFRRSRVPAALAAFAVLAGIEVVMREFVFGALAAVLTALFLPPRPMKGIARAALVGLTALVCARIFAPAWWFN